MSVVALRLLRSAAVAGYPRRFVARLVSHADACLRATAEPCESLGGSAGDNLQILIPGLFPQGNIVPFTAQIMADGTVTLPMIGAVRVAGMNVGRAQAKIDTKYKNDKMLNSRVSVSVAERATIEIAVLGQVAKPGVVILRRNQDDVAHAIAEAGGLNQYAAEVIEIHRRVSPEDMAAIARVDAEIEEQRQEVIEPVCLKTLVIRSQAQRAREFFSRGSLLCDAGDAEALANAQGGGPGTPEGGTADRPARSRVDDAYDSRNVIRRLPTPTTMEDLPLPGARGEEKMVLRIPLRGGHPTISIAGHVVPYTLKAKDVRLRPGDVVMIPVQRDETFFVVGPLSQVNSVIFSVQDRDRRLGNAFLLPPDRDIDVVTAVTMAGYIDPINSPTTVTLQRSVLCGPPLLVTVDLIKARYDWKENLFVQPGDIIYLNPDAAWWSRRLFDRVLPDLITIPYGEAMERWINPGRF